jgi:serine/threonine protein phosphatase 1
MGGIKKFEKNQTGRDFITGDIHGAYDLLDSALIVADFDPAHDRLFCAGDLINRGPSSERVLEFLDRPYFHTIQGNHEIALLRTFRSERDGRQAHISNLHMEWVMAQMSTEERATLLERLENLPYVIEIETARGNVGIVHGEVPAGLTWQQFLDRVSPEHSDHPEFRSVMHSMYSGRERYKNLDTSGVDGIGRVFYGHTTNTSGPLKLGNCFYIDTGSYKAALGNAGPDFSPWDFLKGIRSRRWCFCVRLLRSDSDLYFSGMRKYPRPGAGGGIEAARRCGRCLPYRATSGLRPAFISLAWTAA